jgi:formylglycine-generating enzyme required for sulfatase activity
MRQMAAAVLCLCAIAGAAPSRAAGGPQWARADNGRDIDWADAKAFCGAMGPGWRLPSVAELEALYGGSSRRCGTAICRTSLKLRLTGAWFWSNEEVGPDQARDPGDLAWGVLLVNGEPTQNLRPIDYGARALCVRGS